MDDLLAALSRLFPPDRLLTRPAQLAPYESDALTAYRVRPLAVVIPETQQEVIQAVRLCHQHGTPFVGAWQRHQPVRRLAAGRDGVVIALNRLNHILRLDPRERLAVVEPGVVNWRSAKRRPVTGCITPRTRPASRSAPSAAIWPSMPAAPTA